MKISIRKAIDEIKTFSRVFIERPRFAMVISVVLTMAGVLSITKLPICQYPQLTPPEIKVSCNYPGANSQEVMKTVATPIEYELNGVDDMIYMSSDSGDDGSYSLTISFEVESNRDMDLVKVQNRLSQAEAKLPAEVKQLGTRVRAQSTDFLGFLALRSPNGTLSTLELSDYAYQNLQPVLLRVPGVGEAQIYGPKLSVRIWLDPERLAAQGMNSEEVIAAISKQNIQASLGSVGTSPAQEHGAFTYSLIAKGRLMTAAEFDEIIVRRDQNGGIVKLKDVARTEIGKENYFFDGQYNGKNTINIAIQQKPGANAIQAMDQVIAEMKRLEANFPDDMKLEIAYDATDYVRRCIEEIVITLLITFTLVVFVCYLFLQDWRATLIPCLTIPVSLCSTFIFMAVLGYSINILTLFGLVLAIGVVVDDCIVVVERVQFLIETRHLNAKEAAIQAMSDVTSAVIATTLVLLGIFVPVGFMTGITGRIYQQFSVTLSAAVCFSSLCALTLAPALCSLLLHEARPYKHGPFAWFNSMIAAFKGFFISLARWLSSRLFLVAMLLVLTALLTISAFMKTKTSFLPDEDQRVVFASMQLPEGSTLDRTKDCLLRGVELLKTIPEVDMVLSIEGFSMVAGRGENVGTYIIQVKPWEERTRPDQAVAALTPRIKALLETMPEPIVQAFAPPAIPGLGADNSIDVRVQSINSTDPVLLDNVKNKLLAKLNPLPSVMVAFSGFNAKTPHLYLDIDRAKAEMLKVPVATAYATLQNYLGSRYVNDVNLGTQVNRVTVQSDWTGRANASAVKNLYVRSETGAMVPIGSLGEIHRELGPRSMGRYNMYPAAGLKIMPMPGVASGEVLSQVKEVLAQELPEGFTYEFSGLTYQEQKNAGTAAPLIALAILFGYLFLVAQYESWTIPLPVMLSIFVAVFGALMGLKIYGFSMSIYAQLGLVLLIGLASKNAILIVEFAKDKREGDKLPIVEAASLAAGERLRALLMTALTTLLGTLPMMLATGAGAASRNHLGTTEFFGMLFSVSLGILLVPGLYALFQTMRENVKRFFAYIAAVATRKRRLKDAATLMSVLIAAYVVAGCTSLPSVGPDYEEPKYVVPEYELPDAGLPEGAETDRVILSNDKIMNWWKLFKDPVLVELVDTASTNSLSYLIAQKRLEAAQFELLGSYAAFLPKFGINGLYQHRELRQNNLQSGGIKTDYNVSQVALDGNWEIDVFGGSRRLYESSLAEAESARWSVAQSWVELTTEIGRQYVNLRTTQHRLHVAERNLALQSETYEIVKSRFDVGIGDELSVNQCRYIMEQTRARIPQLKAQEEQLKNAIELLCGLVPGSLHDKLVSLEDDYEPSISPVAVSVLPLDMIRARPDVLAAERKLAAQTARIGVAKAQWFPKLYINGTVGLESKKATKLFSKESLFATIGPAVSWPIFQGGAIYANVKAQEAATEAAAFAYQAAIEKGYAEVRNAYAAYTQEYHRAASLEKAVEAASSAVDISQDLHRNGLRDFNNVIDAQRSRLQLEEEYVISRGQITLDLIDLYRALGGGLAQDK